MTVTAPAGFRAAGVAAGLKDGGRRDLAVVLNDGPGRAAAAVFTRNRVVAAPVVWTRAAVADGVVGAVVLNSGGANACTGREGYLDTVRTAEHAGRLLAMPASEVAVCSTGLIGERLPVDRVLAGLDEATDSLSVDGAAAAAEAILTTDTVAKTAFALGSGWSVGGMAKGAGMLAPGLATMLVVITTDADVPAAGLDHVLREVTVTTFDRVDSDGCMSTNDTVLLLASGASGTTPGRDEFRESLHEVCASLSRQLVADAEGASKDIRIEVLGAVSTDDAVAVARSVARSSLFKCAIHGEDPNWGRVLAAVGTTAAAFDPAQLGVAINGVWLARQGAAAADRGLVDLSGREVQVTVDLGAGGAAATVWTNDLTAAYVHENSAYSS
ncbi:MAG TPA: bifunctional glutamate N-acetyltransferase/amino-acid acetyltransferase ArgJ [Actinomycetes bacterium]|nr:bifunctional glutamate N-acetyltransferase/amino-acid acetyltransferase ArgJ [Actinomycetes bacterium]